MQTNNEKNIKGVWYAVANDKFMSGWGLAQGGVSYYAVACDTLEEAKDAERRMHTRDDFKYVRITKNLPRGNRFRNDHLSVAGFNEFTYGSDKETDRLIDLYVSYHGSDC